MLSKLSHRNGSAASFSFRWHPGAIDTSPLLDCPPTLIAFKLEELTDGLMVTESGFDHIQLARRAKAFTDNEKDSTMAVKLIGERMLSKASLLASTGNAAPIFTSLSDGTRLALANIFSSFPNSGITGSAH